MEVPEGVAEAGKLEQQVMRALRSTEMSPHRRVQIFVQLLQQSVPFGLINLKKKTKSHPFLQWMEDENAV